MRRRRFLSGAAGASAAALTWPAFLAHAFGQDVPRADEEALLRTAIDGARLAERPVLVLVVPSDASTSWTRGNAFGELLQNADQRTMAELALADLVSVRAATVRSVVGSGPADEPLLILIETSSTPPTAHGFDASLDAPPYGGHESHAAIEAAIDAHIASLSALVHAAIAPDAATVTRRATEARAHGGLSAVAPLLAERRPITSAAVHAGAAILLEAALAREDEAVFALLAGEAHARLRDHDIAGSTWGSADCPTCGMGYVPPRSRLFLYWVYRR